MAAVLGADRRTIQRRFATVIENGRANGRMSLKRKQFDLAMKGNVTMLIWLGKQTLGQRDVPRDEGDGVVIPAPVYSMVQTKAKEAV